VIELGVYTPFDDLKIRRIESRVKEYFSVVLLAKNFTFSV